MSSLPVGTVTFLFTDIEGSTQLWQRHPQDMPAALARHHELLRHAIEAHRGYIFQIIGDAFCAAFSTALDGLQAAADAQRALQMEPWGATGPIRVRMALHSGAAEVHPGEKTSGEYASNLTLSRAARLLSAGHGGQVLLSKTTTELLAYDLFESAGVRDLGEHRLKDLQRPEHIFQLISPDLPLEFPPLKTLEAFPNNLPVQLTSFIGREKEIAEIKSMLAPQLAGQDSERAALGVRLITLTGAGGVGKTRLSLQVGIELLETFSAGVWLVELASLNDPELVPQAVAPILGVTEKPGQTLTASIVDFLRNRSTLLILDNCEHLVAACAQIVDRLLRACPKLAILTSSREGLGLAGEVTYNVPPLNLPDPLEAQFQPEKLEAFESFHLFTERARSVQPRFQLNADNARAIVQICRRLDGIPLAIEMAAARMRMLSAEQIAARLDARFRLLTDGGRLAPARQQTLHALIDWSYDLLQISERLFLSRLSVFAGGWTLEAAEQVCAGSSPVGSSGVIDAAGDSPLDAFELLSQLVNKSLVVVDFDQAGETRYHFLDTIRQYAREKLVESGELEIIQDRHLDYFLSAARAAEPFLESIEQAAWLNLLEKDYDNLRAALRWAIEGKQIEQGLQLAEALKIFWYTRGYFSEGREWLNGLLELIPSRSLRRAMALDQAGFLARYQCDFTAANALIGESLSIWRELRDMKGQADSLANLGYVTLFQGDLEKARVFYDESLQINRSLGNQQGIADSLSHLGMIHFYIKDFEKAGQLHQESLSIWQSLGDKTGVSHALNRLASVAYESGQPDQAHRLALESLRIAQELKYSEGIAWALELFAIHSVLKEQPEQAVFLEAIYTKYRSATGVPQSPAQSELLRRWLAPAHNSLSGETLDQAWAAGERAPMEQVIARILEEKAPYFS